MPPIGAEKSGPGEAGSGYSRRFSASGQAAGSRFPDEDVGKQP
jgi:hypothetical protein